MVHQTQTNDNNLLARDFNHKIHFFSTISFIHPDNIYENKQTERKKNLITSMMLLLFFFGSTRNE